MARLMNSAKLKYEFWREVQELVFEIWYRGQRSFECWLRKPHSLGFWPVNAGQKAQSRGNHGPLDPPSCTFSFIPHAPSLRWRPWLRLAIHRLIQRHVPKTWFAETLVRYTRANVIQCFGQVVGEPSRTACHLRLCIRSPLCLSVWNDTVSNFIMDTQYWALLLFIVQ